MSRDAVMIHLTAEHACVDNLSYFIAVKRSLSVESHACMHVGEALVTSSPPAFLHARVGTLEFSGHIDRNALAPCHNRTNKPTPPLDCVRGEGSLGSFTVMASDAWTVWWQCCRCYHGPKYRPTPK